MRLTCAWYAKPVVPQIIKPRSPATRYGGQAIRAFDDVAKRRKALVHRHSQVGLVV